MAKEIENPFAAQLRIRRGNTPQGVFAEQLGLKQAVYSHYENRRREPTLDELCRIARVLGITPNDLLGFSSASSAPSAGDKQYCSTGLLQGSRLFTQEPKEQIGAGLGIIERIVAIYPINFKDVDKV